MIVSINVSHIVKICQVLAILSVGDVANFGTRCIYIWLVTLLVRDSMLIALYAITRLSVRPSVCLSVCHTGGSVKNGLS